MNKGKIMIIEPLTRMGGEAKITICLDRKGNTKDAYFQSMNLRAFEGYIVGRQAEDVPRIASHICGGSSWANHLAAVKAMDHLFGMVPPKPAKMLRELSYCAHIIQSHLLHLFFMAGPDLFLPIETETATRNFLGLLQKYPELTKKGLGCKFDSEEILRIISGRAVHPTFAVPGGVMKGFTEKERKEITKISQGILDNVLDLISFFKSTSIAEANSNKSEHQNPPPLETNYMGTVSDRNDLSFYDGDIRVVDKGGDEVSRFNSLEYREYIEEEVKPWTYSKFAYLKKSGSGESKEGEGSSIFRVGPLPRLNVCEGIPTPRAQEAYDDFVDTLGKPCHTTLGYHWARLVEVTYGAERMIELLEQPDIVRPDIRNYEGNYTGAGVGLIEAPQGTLIHQYEADENGVITNCTLVTPMEMNNAAICMEVRRTAEKIITKKKLSKTAFDRIEMSVRPYDPCPSC